MNKALIDISVLLIFFTRYEQFKQVFEQVRIARPSRLFLYQDGPRENYPEDIENIKKCREIAESVDWDCKIFRLYQKKNIGVDPSGYIADRWAFSQTDKCIVLEDDVVPSISFFSFCKEMLDRYENENKIMLISGFNVEEITKEIKEDYFFTATTFTWGWASWSRVVNKWDGNYDFLDNKLSVERIKKYIKRKGLVKTLIPSCRYERKIGISRFETILIANQCLEQGLTITPKKNMINNIGVVTGSTHYVEDISLIPKGYRRIFTMDRYEIDILNIVHPKIIEDNENYLKKAYRIYGWKHPFVKCYRLLETTFYQIKKGNITKAVKIIFDRLKKFSKGLVG